MIACTFCRGSVEPASKHQGGLTPVVEDLLDHISRCERSGPDLHDNLENFLKGSLVWRLKASQFSPRQ